MQSQVLAYLAKHPARRLLWLASEAAPADVHACAMPLARNTADALKGRHFDCVVIEHLPGPLDLSEAEALVAQLRDVIAQRILWVVGANSPWTRQELLALGFRQLDENEDGVKLFGYDIDNYKQTPDWLNSKNWANPERWDKKRW